ncbi:MAG: pitrilysin family protein [Planctomycetota bacterium]|nr:pitrilysin family protein [Planctomycetota bacterium]
MYQRSSQFAALVVTLLATTLLSPNRTKADEANMPEKIRSIEGITEYRLANGLQVLLFPDSSKPVFTVSMTVMVGSRHEGYGEAGMAHLLEHMLFKGTENHPAIPKVLKERGASFNGTTWYDRTNYYETLSATGDNLEFAIRMEADRLVNSLIKGEDLATEMSVVRSEFESGENSPERVLQQRMFSGAFQWHNYAKSTIGNRSDIERVPVKALRDFYKKYYRPDNTMLVVSGKFDTKEVLGLIQKYFGILEAPQRPIDKTYTVEPPQDGERTTVVRRVADSQFVGTTYHIPAGSDPSYPALEILAMVMADEPSGRLYKSMIETKKASSMQGGEFALHDPGAIFFLAEVPKDKSLEEARIAMIATLEELVKDPVTEQEVERAKTQILKSRELRAANPNTIAVELSEWASQGDWRLYFLYRDRVEKVTAADVQAAAEKYLVRNNRTVGLFIPSEKAQRVELPERIDIAAALADYKGREAISQGEDFDPSPEVIEARTLRGNLESGVLYSYLPKKTRGSTVQLAMNLRFGDERALFGKTTASEFVGPMLLRGSEDYSFQEIKDKLDQLLASVSIDSRPQILQIRLQTKRENLIAVLDILNSIVRRPSFPEKEFEVLRDESIVGTEAQMSDPQALAPNAVAKALNTYKRGDIRYSPSIQEELEDLKALKLEDVKALYKSMIAGSSGEVSVVGDFDPEEVTKKLTQILDGWKSETPYQRAASVANIDVRRPIQLIETPDKANSVYYGSQQYELRDDNARYPALLIGNYIFGGGAISSRLGDRVRQKEGLSYGVGSGVQAHPIDERGSLTIYAIANPDNREKVVAAIEQEMQRLIKDGVTEEELKAAKDGYLQAQQVGRTSDARLADLLSMNLFAGRNMGFYATTEAKIAKLTTDEVNEAIRKYFDPETLVIVTAGDFARSAKPTQKPAEQAPAEPAATPPVAKPADSKEPVSSK